MASFEVTKFTIPFIFAIVLLLSSFLHVLATRPLDDGDEEHQVPSSSSFNGNLIVQSLQRGPVPPSAGNPCTNIPGRNQGRCTLAEMNTVGGSSNGRVAAYHAPPAFPEFIVKFAAASAGSNETDQN